MISPAKSPNTKWLRPHHRGLCHVPRKCTGLSPVPRWEIPWFGKGGVRCGWWVPTMVAINAIKVFEIKDLFCRYDRVCNRFYEKIHITCDVRSFLVWGSSLRLTWLTQILSAYILSPKMAHSRQFKHHLTSSLHTAQVQVAKLEDIGEILAEDHKSNQGSFVSFWCAIEGM